MVLDAIRESFKQEGINALFVSKKSNVFYLTGLSSSNAYILITESEAFLFTDSRYIDKAKKLVQEPWQVEQVAPSLITNLHKKMAFGGVTKFGIEASDLSVALFEKIKHMGATQSAVITDGLVERVRMIKRDEELRALRQSQKTNEQVLKLLVKELKTGVTEAEMAWRLKVIAHDIGTQGVSFDPIIAFGSHTAIPHHESLHKKKLRKGDMVLIDMGVKVKDMCSDMTRTFFTKSPNRHQQLVYETVLRAQEAAVESVKPGNTVGDIDDAARSIIERAGHGEKFGHATGHGIGLDVHELPFIRRSSDQELNPGMVLAIEPGIYFSGKFGVRIEDMVEVTEKGGKNLNKFSKDLDDMILSI